MSGTLSLMNDADFLPDVEFTPEKLMQAGGGVGYVVNRDDALMHVEFYDRDVVIPSKSNEEGIHTETKTYARIQRIGDKSTIVDQPVKNQWIKRWPLQYRAYLDGKDQTIGTPLAKLVKANLTTKDVIDTMRATGVKTIEQAASASDSLIASWGTEGIKVQKYCRGWLIQAERSEAAKEKAQVSVSLQEMQATIEDLKAQLAEKSKPLAEKVEKKVVAKSAKK